MRKTQSFGMEIFITVLVTSVIALVIGFFWGNYYSAGNTEISCFQSPENMNFTGFGDDGHSYTIYNQCGLNSPFVFWNRPISYNKSIVLFLQEIMKSGAVGLAIGRNIWQDENPLDLTKKLKKIVWGEK